MQLASRIGLLALGAMTTLAIGAAGPRAEDGRDGRDGNPIRHVVVIFQENITFDHYFASYPMAANRAGEPSFIARRHTPAVNGLTGTLLTNNPNEFQPFRLDRSEAFTCDQDHGYTNEQKAADGGLLDRFVQATGRTGIGCLPFGQTVMLLVPASPFQSEINTSQVFKLESGTVSVIAPPTNLFTRTTRAVWSIIAVVPDVISWSVLVSAGEKIGSSAAINALVSKLKT